MKKIITILALFVSATSFAQSGVQSMTGSGSITSGTPGYVTALIGGYGHIGIQLNLAKTSGTVAGIATLQASLDGVNYDKVPGSDTLTLADVSTNTHIWKVSDNSFKYYRVKVATTGTNVTTGTGYYVLRIHN